MPFLGNKVHVLNHVTNTENLPATCVFDSFASDEAHDKYFISETCEQCQSEEEFLMKSYLYNQKIWSCRCSAKSCLTWREACKSEISIIKELRHTIPIYFERAIFAAIHHENETLEALVHKAFLTLHDEFCINETVALNASKAGKKSIMGVVMKIEKSNHSNESNGTSTSEDNSAESVKENESKSTDNSHSGKKEKTGKKLSTNTPSKSDYRYMVKISNSQLVSGIPASVLVRQVRPPTKEQIRNLIRAFCFRQQGNVSGPWIVEENVTRKYNIPDKIENGCVNIETLAQSSRKAEVQTYLKKTRKSKSAKSNNPVKKSVHSISIISDDKDIHGSNATDQVKQVTLYSTSPETSNAKVKRGRPRNQLSPSKVKSLCKVKPVVTKRSQNAIKKLLEAHEEGKPMKAFGKLAATCARICNQQQIDQLPDEIRQRVKTVKDRFDLKKKMENMTPEQLKDYRLQRRKVVLQQMHQKRHERNYREEDQTIETDVDLPQPTSLNDLPEGVEAGQWIQCLGFTEMLYSMQGLLRQHSGKRCFKLVSVEKLIQALRRREVCWLNNLLEIVLKTMLQDESLGKVCELSFGLSWSKIQMTRQNISEILRLVLKTQIAESTANCQTTSSSVDDEIEEFPEDDTDEYFDRKATTGSSAAAYETVSLDMIDLVESLKEKEFYDLTFNEKLLILELIKIRFLNLTIVNNYFEDLNKMSCESFKTKMDSMKVAKDLKKAMPAFQQMRQREGANSLDEDPEKALDEAEKKLSCADQEWRLVSNNTKNALRLGSLGVDRHHRRYWIFRTAPPGIYLEQNVDENLLNYGQFDCNHRNWFVFNSEEVIDQLIHLLHDHGIREHNLKVELKKVLPNVKLSIQKYQESKLSKDGDESFSKEDELSQSTSQSNEDTETYFNTSMTCLKNEFVHLIISVYMNSMINLASLNQWLIRANSPGQTFNQLKDFIIHTTTQLPLALLARNSKSHDHNSETKAELELVNDKEPSPLDEWQTEILYAKTISRLAFLQHQLEISIKSRHIIPLPQCFICKTKFSKSCDYSTMSLYICSSCHKLAHETCLTHNEQPLPNSSIDDWLCPPCRVKKFTSDRKGPAKSTKTVTISLTSPAIESEETCNKSTPETLESSGGRIRKKNVRYADPDFDTSSIGEESSLHSTRPRSVSRLSNASKSSVGDKTFSPQTKPTKTGNRGTKRPAHSPSSLQRNSRLSKRRAIDSFVTRGSPTKKHHNGESDSSWSYDSPDESGSSVSKDSEQQSATDREDNFCLKLIDNCLKHRSSSYFRELVDAEEVPDYYDIVTEPLSLSMIQDRLLNGDYGHGKHCLVNVLEDLKLLFSNARLYNSSDSEVVDQAKKLESFMLSVLARSNYPYNYEREFS